MAPAHLQGHRELCRGSERVRKHVTKNNARKGTGNLVCDGLVTTQNTALCRGRREVKRYGTAYSSRDDVL